MLEALAARQREGFVDHTHQTLITPGAMINCRQIASSCMIPMGEGRGDSGRPQGIDKSGKNPSQQSGKETLDGCHWSRFARSTLGARAPSYPRGAGGTAVALF